jgi:hypothetical protein
MKKILNKFFRKINLFAVADRQFPSVDGRTVGAGAVSDFVRERLIINRPAAFDAAHPQSGIF